MYMYKDDAGYFFTNEYYDTLTYWNGNDEETNYAEFICATEDYEDVVDGVVNSEGKSYDILIAMDDFHAEYTPID